MAKKLRTLTWCGLLIAMVGCARNAAVEGSVQMTSTEPFKHLKGNTPHPPVKPPP